MQIGNTRAEIPFNYHRHIEWKRSCSLDFKVYHMIYVDTVRISTVSSLSQYCLKEVIILSAHSGFYNVITANGRPFYGSLCGCAPIDSLLLRLSCCAALSINAKQAAAATATKQQQQRLSISPSSQLVGELLAYVLLACLGFLKVA